MSVALLCLGENLETTTLGDNKGDWFLGQFDSSSQMNHKCAMRKRCGLSERDLFRSMEPLTEAARLVCLSNTLVLVQPSLTLRISN